MTDGFITGLKMGPRGERESERERASERACEREISAKFEQSSATSSIFLRGAGFIDTVTI